MDNSDLLDDLIECECVNCKNVFWVPGFGEVELGLPDFCPFCGIEYNYMEEM